ncbi:hypothetical protein Taro_056780 [Colocasia esculenta]|uniref:Uncharacterized protein n=1 Tax=Colocasia esculenta TaxID=4460 RepID=A0A843XXQ1_COLES|nr:hypothetical protein [Colocasia esculenta]
MIITRKNEKMMKKAMKTWKKYTVSKKVGLAVQENWEEIWKYEEFNDGICPTACDFFCGMCGMKWPQKGPKECAVRTECGVIGVHIDRRQRLVNVQTLAAHH